MPMMMMMMMTIRFTSLLVIEFLINGVFISYLFAVGLCILT